VNGYERKAAKGNKSAYGILQFVTVEETNIADNGKLVTNANEQLVFVRQSVALWEKKKGKGDTGECYYFSIGKSKLVKGPGVQGVKDEDAFDPIPDFTPEIRVVKQKPPSSK
jgi:hypothetical protein